jgi:hypothetical protein
MKNIFIITILVAFVKMNCFGQDAGSQNPTNEFVKAQLTAQKILLGNWQNYATNNPYTKGLIQQKYNVESQIALLQKQRFQFIAEDHYSTYTNTPYLIIDERGYNRVYSSREAYDNEIIGGLIKSSLNINNEIIKQKNLYFAAYASNVSASVIASPASPISLKATNN